MDKAADFIAAALPHGNVLCHCKAGICRSPTMIIAYLLKYRSDVVRHSVAEALALVREGRACASPRREFLVALEEYAARLEQVSAWRAARDAFGDVEPAEEQVRSEEARSEEGACEDEVGVELEGGREAEQIICGG